MFDTTPDTTDTRTPTGHVEAWEDRLLSLEAEISQRRAAQIELLRKLDRHQVDAGAGMRTMGDWVSAHLDVSKQTADRLWQLARAGNAAIDTLMGDGRCGLDRGAVLVKLQAAGVDAGQLGDATAIRFSLARLYGLLERARSFTADEERSAFEHRYLVIQPSLDDAACAAGRPAGPGDRPPPATLPSTRTDPPATRWPRCTRGLQARSLLPSA